MDNKTKEHLLNLCCLIEELADTSEDERTEIYRIRNRATALRETIQQEPAVEGI